MGGKIKMYFSKMKLQNFTSYLTFFFFLGSYLRMYSSKMRVKPKKEVGKINTEVQ